MTNTTNIQYLSMLERFTLFSDFFMHARLFQHSRKGVQASLARIVTGKKDLIVVEWGLEVKKGFSVFFDNDS